MLSRRSRVSMSGIMPTPLRGEGMPPIEGSSAGPAINLSCGASSIDIDVQCVMIARSVGASEGNDMEARPWHFQSWRVAGRWEQSAYC